jgi:ABC-type nitrate/sulfonate/bicarbonate transport system substrate-binding protein
MSRLNSEGSSRVSTASVLATIAAVGALLLTPAYAQDTAKAGAKKFGIAVYPGLFLELPVYAAKSAGIFAKNGIEPDLVLIAGGPNQAAAVTSGDMDAFAFPVNSVLPLRAKGQVFTGIVNLQGPAIYTVFGATDAVNKCPNARDPYPGPLKCLKGQSVGVAQLGGDSFVVFMAMLKDAGLAQKDLNLVSVGASSNLANAFKAGQIKFAIGVEPAPAVLETSLGLTTTLISLAGKDVGDTFSPWVGETFWGFQTAMQKDPEKFTRFKHSIIEAIKWLQDPRNKDKVQAIMQKDMGFDEKTARSLADKQLDTFSATMDCKGFNKAKAFAISTGALPADNKETCKDVMWSGSQDLLVNK